jgi:hypothetical protein
MNLRSPPARYVALAVALLLASTAPQAADRAQTAYPAGDAAKLDPPSPPATGHGGRAIFVCRDTHGPVFSDRPCGAVIENREIALAAPSGTAPSTSPRPTTAKPLPRKVATRQRPLENGDRGCERLRSRLDTLDDRMRAGYSSRESERLWQQWRELKTEIHRRRC